jgi:hypothetical protein
MWFSFSSLEILVLIGFLGIKIPVPDRNLRFTEIALNPLLYMGFLFTGVVASGVLLFLLRVIFWVILEN